ncbi:MAG: GNAT family N-acetyltransferase [Motilibacteraceae bacterium]
MRVEQLPDPGAFLAATEAIRGTEPVLTNVIGSVAGSVAEGRQYQRCWWWVVRDDHGSVVGCAIRTAPFLLAVSPMPAEAAAALGREVARADGDLPGSVGPADVVGAVLEAAAPGVLRHVHRDELVRVVHEFRPAHDVAGTGRRAHERDTELLVDWWSVFAAEAAVAVVHDVEANVRANIEQGSLWVWEVDGEPVSMAGHAPLVATPAGTVGRIGPVFTPAEHRQHGYGAAVTSAVVDALLPHCDTVMLYTDAANPTSNGVYARLGFDVVAQVVEVLLQKA